MSSAFPGDQVRIEFRGFHSSAEGETFSRIVESISAEFVNRLATNPSQIDHLLVVIDQALNATVYLNELSVSMLAQARQSKQTGSPVAKADLADIRCLDLGVEIPTDCGFFYIFSQGWRKGFFLDFGPFQTGNPRRDFEIGPVLGACYAALMFSERFALSESEWDDLIAKGWFPFIGLPDATAQRMIEFLRSGVDLDRLVPEIEPELGKIGMEAVSLAENNPSFLNQAPFIRTAIDRLLAQDYISAAHILYPRIEGMLRTFYNEANTASRPHQADLIGIAFPQNLQTRHSMSVLRIDKFSSFIGKIIFAPFDWQQPAGASRHTIGHGVAQTGDISPKSVLLAMLSIHHLLFTLMSRKAEEEAKQAAKLAKLAQNAPAP